MSTAGKPVYQLENAEERNKAHPRTFWLPESGGRKNVPVDYFVKLIFLNPEGLGERMWIKVSEKLPDGSYKGILYNDPVVVTLMAGDEIEFRPEHVIDIQKFA